MEPDSPSPQITYQAYKSKRHSRTVSNPPMAPNVSPLSVSRPSSIVGSPTPSAFTSPAVASSLHQIPTEKENTVVHEFSNGSQSLSLRLDPIPFQELPSSSLPSTDAPGELSEPSSPGTSSKSIAILSPTPPALDTVPVPSLNGRLNGHNESEPGPSSMPSSPKSSLGEFDKQKQVTRKSSTFRHIPLRNPSRSPLPSSPLRPIGPYGMISPVAHTPHTPDRPRATESRSRITSITSSVSEAFNEKQLPTISSADIDAPLRLAQFSERVSPEQVVEPPLRSTTLVHPPKSSPTTASPSPTASPAPSLVNLPNVSATLRPSAPYRPGFQPKGVYRPRTDEFSAVRKQKRDFGRVERTKLERRLEKLINLHFSSDEDQAIQLNQYRARRRVSSIFDLDLSDLKNMDASGLWRGMLQSQNWQGTKAEIRVAEQSITPWQDDATVSKCPLCSASFHPLTNRKHHCRLCGQIICSLPVKHPQRPVACSLLFVVDPKTQQIEEVGEGVDYGVRKRRTPSVSVQGKRSEKEEALPEDEKFLKGVRICKDCRPILLRQQYLQEVRHIPTIGRLYEAFIVLEKEIEDSLPQFQELLINLGNDVQPTKEASTSRKRILQAFAQYDTLSKRIRTLPCPGGPGSSQDRIQLAILTRANLFLQRNMFPLQALPTSKKTKTSSSPTPENDSVIDLDSEMAHALQPLLEQEALLESFVEEAKARRKFEDAKTLKANLTEIRAEIDRVVANADGGMHQSGKTSSRAKVSK